MATDPAFGDGRGDNPVKALRCLPLRTVDECSGWPTEPLGDAHREIHVRKTSGSQVRQPARRALELLCELCPGQIEYLPFFVERSVCLCQVPTKSAVCACVRQ